MVNSTVASLAQDMVPRMLAGKSFQPYRITLVRGQTKWTSASRHESHIPTPQRLWFPGGEVIYPGFASGSLGAARVQCIPERLKKIKRPSQPAAAVRSELVT